MRLFVISLKCSPTHAVDSKLDFAPFFFFFVVTTSRYIGLLVSPVLSCE